MVSWNRGSHPRGDTIKPTVFCFSKKPNQTKPNTNHLPKPPETVTREGICKAGCSVASSSYEPSHPLPVLGCLDTQWSYPQPGTHSSLGQSLGHGLCWGSWPAKHLAQPLTDPTLAARDFPGSGPPGKLNILLPVVDLARDVILQNLACSKESFVIGYSCENLIYLEKAAIKLLLLVKGSFCHLIAYDSPVPTDTGFYSST